MADSSAWVADHRGDLVGGPVRAAVDLVARAQLHSRVAGPGEVLTLEFRPDRVTLLADDRGTVVDVRAG